MNARACLLAAGLAAALPAAAATEYGYVLSTTPVTATVAVPQTVCSDALHPVAPVTSGAGALFGAVLGGLVGSAIGGGSGQAAATGLGVVAGAMAGDRNEALHSPAAAMRRCHTTTVHENRLVGYDVVYEYRGERMQARVERDPGSRIPLNVSVAPVGLVAEAPAYAPPPPQAVLPPPVYVAPAPYPHYGYGVPAFSVMPSLFIGGHWHRGGGHRRHR